MYTDIYKLYEEIINLVPVTHNGNEPLSKVLYRALSKYVIIVRDCSEQLFEGTGNSKKDILMQVESLNNSLCRCMRYYLQGKHLRAYDELDQVLSKMPMCFRKISYFSEMTDFYRMRLKERGKTFTRKDMYHIPVSLRGKVRTQRFSSPGLPCLYLGSNLQACWEEMHRPPLAECMFNRYHAEECFRLLSLELPEKNRWERDFSNILKYFPLIIACMIKVDDYQKDFKAEYIIPQLLMERVMSGVKVGDEEILGISYTSVHYTDEFEFPRNVYNNLAIPVKDSEEGNYSKEIAKYFTSTNPTSEEIELIKYGSLYLSDERKHNINDLYQTSLFGILEKIMSTFETYELDFKE